MSIPPRPDIDGHPSAPTGPEPLPRASWSFAAPIGVYLAGLFLAAGLFQTLPGSFLDSDGGYVLALAATQVVPVLGLLVWLRLAHPNWMREMGVATWRGGDIGYGAVAGLAIFVGAGAFGVALDWAYKTVAGEPLQTPDQVPGGLPVWATIVVGIAVIVGAPLTEEFFFRGCVFRGIRRSLALWPAAVLSAVVFALPHYLEGDVPTFGKWTVAIIMIPVGTAFAWVYERRASLWTSIAAHAMFNIIGFSFILLSW